MRFFTSLPAIHYAQDNCRQNRLVCKGLRIVVVEKNILMSIIVPDEILTVTRMTEAEMRQEIAIMLFQKEKLTLQTS